MSSPPPSSSSSPGRFNLLSPFRKNEASAREKPNGAGAGPEPATKHATQGRLLSGMSMSDLLDDNHAIKTAIIQCTVNIFGLLCVIILYYNYLLLEPYFYAFFWAILTSIPLHGLKRMIIRLVLSSSLDEHQHAASPSVFRIFFTLNKVVLKFLVGPLWPYLAAIPRGYFAKLGQIEHFQRSRREYRLSRVQDAGDTKKATHRDTVSAPKYVKDDRDGTPIKRESKLQPSTPVASADRFYSVPKSPSTIIEESIQNEIFSTKSGPYFAYLFRLCGLYLCYLLMHTIPLQHWIFFSGLFFALTLMHILYHAFNWLYALYVEEYCVLLRQKTSPGFLVLCRCADLVSFGVFKRLYKRCKAMLSTSGRFYRGMREDMRQETRRQINSIVAGLILFTFVLGSLCLTVFLAFQFFYEVNIFVDHTVAFVNETVIHNERLKDIQFKEKFKASLDEAALKGISWADVQLKEKFPSHNITVSLLYEKAFQTYSFLFSNSSYSGTSASSSFTDTKLNTIFLTHLPVTSGLVRELFRGNFSILLDVQNLMASGNELRSGLVKVAQAFFQYDKEYIESTLQSLESSIISLGQAAFSHSTALFSYLSLVTLTLLNVFIYGFNMLAQFCLFFITLYYLLLPEKDPLDYLSQLIVAVDTKQVFRSSVEKAIKGVFITTLKMLIFHALFTWITFKIFDVQFAYIGTFAAGLIAIIPVASPLWVVVPACAELYLRDQGLAAVFFFLLHYAVTWFVDPAIYSDIPDSHPYFSGLSIVLGLWAFGWHGFVTGPLLACLPVIAFHLYAEMLSS